MAANRKWLMPVIIIGVIVLLFFLFAMSPYNTMIAKEESVETQWAQVENVYQRKFDLIPNMVATAKNYAQFEQETLTEVIEARSKATQLTLDPENLTQENLQQFQQNYEQINQATFGRLLATFERYPELKASELYNKLQDELAGSENRISNERRVFNEVVRDYNTYIRQFPRNIVASFTGFERKALFENEAAAEGGKVDVNEEFKKE